jgi:hypothetical protein
MVGGDFMERLAKRFEMQGTLSRLYWRIYQEYVYAGFEPTTLLLAVTILGARRIARRYTPA